MFNRRKFLIYSSLIFTSEQICSSYSMKVDLLQDPFQTIYLLHKDLFEIKRNIFDDLRYYFATPINPPKVLDLNSVEYLAGVLQDKRIENSSREYILNGVNWLNESAQESYKKKYNELHYNERNTLLKTINQLEWGDNWLYVIMTYYFESMFCAPFYGGNKNMSGYKWLNYTPGYPLADKRVLNV